MSLVVGVAGAIGSGKDTVAACLIERFGFRRVGFADALKHEVARIWRGTLEAHLRQTFGDAEVERVGLDEAIRRALWDTRTTVTRRLLQEHGTELRRAEDPDYWIARWRDTIGQWSNARIVCPDVRFPNEVAAIRLAGGWLVRVERPGVAWVGHASETSLTGTSRVDATFLNDTTIPVLWNRVSEWVERLLVHTREWEAA